LRLRAYVYEPRVVLDSTSASCFELRDDEKPSLPAAGHNLYELTRDHNLRLSPDAELRAHALNAAALESARGWRLAKEKSSRAIDGLVALSFACLDAVERPALPYLVAPAPRKTVLPKRGALRARSRQRPSGSTARNDRRRARRLR
jgi:hypothetical protein